MCLVLVRPVASFAHILLLLSMEKPRDMLIKPLGSRYIPLHLHCVATMMAHFGNQGQLSLSVEIHIFTC